MYRLNTRSELGANRLFHRRLHDQRTISKSTIGTTTSISHRRQFFRTLSFRRQLGKYGRDKCRTSLVAYTHKQTIIEDNNIRKYDFRLSAGTPPTTHKQNVTVLNASQFKSHSPNLGVRHADKSHYLGPQNRSDANLSTPEH